MQNVLLCPNQIQAHGHHVYEAPKQFEPDSPHMIVCKQSNSDLLTIPLSLHGVFSFFHMHYLTEAKLHNCPHLDLTSDLPWDPYSTAFAKQEERCTKLVETGVPFWVPQMVQSSISAPICKIDVEDCRDQVIEQLVSSINTAATDL